MEGTDLGPTEDDEAVCHEWALEPSTCPTLIDCDYTSCATCSLHKGCAWCGSLDQCMPHSETSFVRCQGKIQYGEHCPYPFTETTKVEGNLVVQGDAELGGGVMHISGPCNKDDCNSKGFHSLVLDGGHFDIMSGGSVSISAANTDSSNVPASEIFLQSGSGTNTVGGSGGDFFAFAGDGARGKPPLIRC